MPQPSWSPSTTQQLRKLVAAPYLAPNDWTPRSEAYFVFPLAQGTPGKQCGLAATGVYQPSLRSPWLAATEMQSKALNNIACILLDQGNYSSALEYFIRAYECTQNTRNSEMNGIALLNIGVTHLELDHLEEAREYLTRSLKSISGIPEIHSRVLQNLSHYYQKKGDLDQAIEYGTQALAGHQSIENIHGTIGTLSNMGEIYLLKNDLDKARHYFEEALQLAMAKDEKTEQAQNHLLLGRVYMRKKQPDVAIPILKKVFEFEQNYKTYIYEAHQELSRLYQVCLRPRDRFWDIPVPKIDSAFDNLFVPQPSWSPSTTQQLRKLVAAPYLAPI